MVDFVWAGYQAGDGMKSLKRWMRIGVGLLVLVLVAALAANWVLKRRLADLLNATLAPAVAARTGADFTIGDASLDLVGGRVHVEDVRLGNQPGFEEAYLFELEDAAVTTSLGRLLRAREIDISSFRVERATLVVERSAEGDLNIRALQQRLAGDPPAAASPGGGTGPKDEGADAPSGSGAEAAPQIFVGTAKVQAVVRYIDHKIRPTRPVEFTLDQTLSVQGLAMGRSGEPATVSLRGGLRGKRDLFRTEIAGTVDAIEDAEALSFALSGSVANIDPSLVEAYLARHDLRCGGLDLELNLVCTQGEFRAGESEIALVMYDLVLPESLARKAGGIETMKRISIPIAIEGPLTSPGADGLLAMLGHVVVTNLVDNPEIKKALAEKVQEALGLGGKPDGGETGPRREEVNETLDKASELLKGLLK